MMATPKPATQVHNNYDDSIDNGMLCREKKWNDAKSLIIRCIIL